MAVFFLFLVLAPVFLTSADKCVSGYLNCGGAYFDAVKADKSNPVDCNLAILNSVKGASTFCCTAYLKTLQTCTEKELGDYTSCKDSWNKQSKLNSNPHDKDTTNFKLYDTLVKASKPGGYCSNPTTGE